MNNITQKNAIRKLISNAELPYASKEYVDYQTDNYTLDCSDVNHSMQQLLDNDLYIEQELNATSAYTEGPKAYDSSTIDSEPNGYKVFGDVTTGECLDVLRKSEKPLSASLVKSTAFSGKANFVCYYNNAIFVGSDSQPLKYTTNIDEDEWTVVDGEITAKSFCIEDEKMFIGATTGVYQLSVYVDYSLDENGQNENYGDTRFSVVRLNSSSKISGVIAVNYNRKKDKLFIATCNSAGKHSMYVAKYLRATPLSYKSKKLSFTKLTLYKNERAVQTASNPSGNSISINQVDHDTKNRTLVPTSNGVYVECMKNQLADRVDFTISDTIGDIKPTCTCATKNGLYLGTNYGLYFLDPDGQTSTLILDKYNTSYLNVDSMLYFESDDMLFVACHSNDSNHTTKLYCRTSGVIQSIDILCIDWPFSNDTITSMAQYKDHILAFVQNNSNTTLKLYTFQKTLEMEMHYTGTSFNIATNGSVVGSLIYSKKKLLVAQQHAISIYSFSPSFAQSELIQSLSAYGPLNSSFGNVKYMKVITLDDGGHIGVNSSGLTLVEDTSKRYSIDGIVDAIYTSISSQKYIVCCSSSGMHVLNASLSGISLAKAFTGASIDGIVSTDASIIAYNSSTMYWISRYYSISSQTVKQLSADCMSIAINGYSKYMLSSHGSDGLGSVHRIDERRNFADAAGAAAQLSILDCFHSYDLNSTFVATNTGLSVLSVFQVTDGKIKTDDTIKYVQIDSKATKNITMFQTELSNTILVANRADGTDYINVISHTKVEQFKHDNTLLNSYKQYSVSQTATMNSIASCSFYDVDGVVATDGSNIYKLECKPTSKDVKAGNSSYVGKCITRDKETGDTKTPIFATVYTVGGIVYDDSGDVKKRQIAALANSNGRIKESLHSSIEYYNIVINNSNYAYMYQYDEDLGAEVATQISCGSSPLQAKTMTSYKISLFSDCSREISYGKYTDKNKSTSTTSSIVMSEPDIMYFVGTDNNLYFKKEDYLVTALTNEDGTVLPLDFDEKPYYEYNCTCEKNEYGFSRYGNINSIDIQKKQNPLLVMAATSGSSTFTNYLILCQQNAGKYSFSEDDSTVFAYKTPIANMQLLKAFFVDDDTIVAEYSGLVVFYKISRMYYDVATATISEVERTTSLKNIIRCNGAYTAYAAMYVVLTQSGQNVYRIQNRSLLATLAAGETINSSCYEISTDKTTSINSLIVYLGTTSKLYKLTLDETSQRFSIMVNGLGGESITSYKNTLMYTKSGCLYGMFIGRQTTTTNQISENGLNISCCKCREENGKAAIYATSSQLIYLASDEYSTIEQSVRSGTRIIATQNQISQVSGNILKIMSIQSCDSTMNSLFFGCEDATSMFLLALSGQNGFKRMTMEYSYVIDQTAMYDNISNLFRLSNSIGYVQFASSKYKFYTIDNVFGSVGIEIPSKPNAFVDSDKYLFVDCSTTSTALWRYLIKSTHTRFIRILHCPTIYSQYVLGDQCYFCTSNGICTIVNFQQLNVALGQLAAISKNLLDIDDSGSSYRIAATYLKSDGTYGIGYVDLKEDSWNETSICCSIPVKYCYSKYAESDEYATTSCNMDVDSIQLSSAWIAGSGSSTKVYCQMNASMASTIQSLATSKYRSKACSGTSITCDFTATSCLNVCSPFKDPAKLSQIACEYIVAPYDQCKFGKYSNQTYMAYYGEAVSFTGFGYFEAFDYDAATGGCNCKDVLRDDTSEATYIASDTYIFKDDGTDIAVSRSIPSTVLSKTSFSNTMKYVVASNLNSNMLSSSNGKLWKKLFFINGSNLTINKMLAYDKWTYAFATNGGLYYTKYQYDLVQDVKAFSQDDAIEMYDEMLEMPATGICAQLCSTLSAHIEESHISSSIISRLNSDFLTNSMEEITTDWQITNDESSQLYFKNDIIQEMLFGSYLDGDLIAYSSNFLDKDDEGNQTCCEIESFSYIMKRWVSGITELYVNIPTTKTYYLPNQYGASNSHLYDGFTSTRKNLTEFGESFTEQDSTLSTHYTKLIVGLASAEYNVDNILDIQINGNSLPLKIYQDIDASKTSQAGKLYRSFIEPSVCTGFNTTTTDDDGYFYFNFACFGSDAQAIKLMFYDRKSRSNAKYVKIVFDPNGGSGTMSNQKFLIGEDGLLEQKNLKKNKFTGDEDGKFFNGWTLQPQPDNYTWDSQEYDGTQKYEDKSAFPFKTEMSEICEELQRDLSEDPFQNKEEITLYASWITYQFTTGDSSLTLQSNKQDFFIADVDVDTSTKLKDNVVVNFGD